jgi:hypothetical protein
MRSGINTWIDIGIINRFSQSLRVRASEVLLYIHCCNFVFVVFFCFRTMSYLIHCYYFLPQANIVPDTQLQFIFCFRTISYLIHFTIYFCFRTISYLIHSYNLFLFFRTIQSYLIHHYFLQRY